MTDEVPEPVRCMNVLLEDDYTLTVQPFSLDELDEILMQSGAVGLYDMDGNECMVGKDRIIAITHGWVMNLGYPQGWVPTVSPPITPSANREKTVAEFLKDKSDG